MNNFSLNNFIFVLFKNNKNYYLKHLKTKKKSSGNNCFELE